MKTSKNGIDLIKHFEGSHLEAYVCPAGKLTIGVGHTGLVNNKAIVKGLKINQQTADKLLANDLTIFEQGVSKLVHVSISQNQFDALVSFAFNLGLGNLGKSTLITKINAKDFIGASEEFSKWIYANGKPLQGLIKRRNAEMELFLKK